MSQARPDLSTIQRILCFAWLSSCLTVFAPGGAFAAKDEIFPLNAAPEWINHDAIAPLPAAASEEQLRFLPIFIFTHGTCLPAPAIDAEGRLGAGLKASGRMDGKCPKYDAANIYVQSLDRGEQRVHVYALYFPKDGSNPNSSGGHRHDWENVLIWTSEGRVTDITFSQHGGYYSLPADKVRFEGERPLIFVGKAKHGMYHGPNNGPGGLIEGLCYFCDTRSDPGLRWFAPHRLLAFESMSERQQELLQSNIWGSANSPFRLDGFSQLAASVAEGQRCKSIGCQCDEAKGSCPGFP